MAKLKNCLVLEIPPNPQQMLKQSEITLKDAIDKLLKTYKLKTKVQEAHITEAWGKIMGRVIERHTLDIYIKNKKLYVKLNSAVVRQELLYARTKIVEKVNEELGEKVIEEI